METFFHNFVNRFFEEIKEAFNQHEFWGNTWLEDSFLKSDTLENYGKPELELLTSKYGTDK